jgi:arylsulfatase A-like enzyme
MPPYVYIENDMPIEEPTAWGSAKEFLREGPRMRSLRANNVLSHLTEKAVEYIENRSDNPFMLYFPLTAPHTPISPAPEFDGVSGVNPYADFCMEVDHRVGQIVDAVRKRGELENTLIVFSTDNGASAGPSECAMLEKRYGHYCSHIYRGYKSDIWDGGHRVPFIMRWGAEIKPGTVCDQQVGVFDFYATVADILGVEVEIDSGEDSISLLPSFYGNQIDASHRQALIHHSINGMFAIRSGKWKLCCCPGSGGWSFPKDDEATNANDLQLYDMTADPSEKRNIIDQHPEVVAKLEKILFQCIVNGSSIVGKKGVKVESAEFEDWEQVKRLPNLPESFVVDD